MSAATERMEVRLTSAEKAFLPHAARLSHESASGFMVRAAQNAAVAYQRAAHPR
ncbi:DUF1778 domain-containing protein [Marinactinospora rubrisoli]|uniref:DUF1778 domain-containing protein n=1 Tax=Marinactinospora rubrisoli TaxID=2715399 RepID=A0ABW2KLB5_9ACTN